MARRDQQIDASNFVYSIDRKIAPFLKITASKRAPHGSEYANRRKKGVRIPPVRGKQWLASMESFVNFRAKKARKRLMPLAFRQWHLYRFDFMEYRNTIDANWAKDEDSAFTNLYLDLQLIPTRRFRLAQPKDPKGV